MFSRLVSWFQCSAYRTLVYHRNASCCSLALPPSLIVFLKTLRGLKEGDWVASMRVLSLPAQSSSMFILWIIEGNFAGLFPHPLPNLAPAAATWSLWGRLCCLTFTSSPADALMLAAASLFFFGDLPLNMSCILCYKRNSVSIVEAESLLVRLSLCIIHVLNVYYSIDYALHFPK